MQSSKQWVVVVVVGQIPATVMLRSAIHPCCCTAACDACCLMACSTTGTAPASTAALQPASERGGVDVRD